MRPGYFCEDAVEELEGWAGVVSSPASEGGVGWVLSMRVMRWFGGWAGEWVPGMWREEARDAIGGCGGGVVGEWLVDL